MSSHLLLLLVLALCISTISGITEEVIQAGQEKLDELRTRSKKSPLLEIAGSDFDTYIARGPRPYFTMVILTAISSGNCQPCEQLHPSAVELAKLIEDQRDKMSNENDVDVFVMNVDFANNKQSFQKLGLSTAPTLVLVPPSKTKKELQLSRFFKQIPTKYQYSLTTGRSPEDIGKWIKDTARIEWLTIGSKMELPPIQYIVLACIGVPALLYVCRKVIDKLRKTMVIYAIASMIVYSFCIGGGMFSQIRQTPWLHKEGNKIGYISHMSRYQFGIETYIIGATNLVAGVAAYVFILAQRSGTHESNNHKFFKYFKYIPTFIPLAIVIAGWYGIMTCYNFKNGHYNMGHVGMTG